MKLNEIKKTINKLQSDLSESYLLLIDAFIKDNCFVYSNAFIKQSNLYMLFCKRTDIDIDKDLLVSLFNDAGYSIGQKYNNGSVVFGISDVEPVLNESNKNKIKEFVKSYMYTDDRLFIPVNRMYDIIHTHVDGKLTNKDISAILFECGTTKQISNKQGYCFKGISDLPVVLVEGIVGTLTTLDDIKAHDKVAHARIVARGPIHSKKVRSGVCRPKYDF